MEKGASGPLLTQASRLGLLTLFTSISSHLGDLSKSRGPKRWCKVNFNYSPEQPDELRLQAGEIVEMIKEVRG